MNNSSESVDISSSSSLWMNVTPSTSFLGSSLQLGFVLYFWCSHLGLTQIYISLFALLFQACFFFLSFFNNCVNVKFIFMKTFVFLIWCVVNLIFFFFFLGMWCLWSFFLSIYNFHFFPSFVPPLNWFHYFTIMCFF